MTAATKNRRKIPKKAPSGYEQADVAPRHVVYVLLGLFGGVLISGGIVAGLFGIFSSLTIPPRLTSQERQAPPPPLPHLDRNPQESRAVIEANSRRRLEGYGWSDKAAGRVHIPIELAMQRLAESGWPDEPGTGERQPSEEQLP